MSGEQRGGSFVSLKAYDALGQAVATLVDDTKLQGTYVVTWNASAAASGVYYYRVIATPLDGRTPFSGTGKMLLIR